MKIERQNGRDYVIHYEDLESLMADSCKNDGNRRLTKSLETSTSMGRGWFGLDCSTHLEFVRRVDQGWPALTKKVEEMSDMLKLSPDVLPVTLTQTTRRRRVRSDSGSDLDIHAVYQGQLDRAWSNTRHEVASVRRKAAHLYVAIGGLGHESADQSLWRAAAAHRICDLFQKCGFTVEITVGSSATGTYSNHVNVHTSFTAKKSSMPIDLNRVALQSTLGWHRVYSFLSRAYNDRGMRCNPGMGSTMHGVVTPYVKEREAAGEMLVVVPSNINSLTSAKRCIEDARKLLENLAKEAA